MTISEQPEKRVRPEKIHQYREKEGSYCGSSDYAAPIPPLIESQYLGHLKL